MAPRRASKPTKSAAVEAPPGDVGSRSTLPIADTETSSSTRVNPLVAAYRAGRTTNQFAWLAEQAVVLGFPELEARSQSVLAELRAHILLAVSQDTREILRDLVTKKLEGFRAQCHSEWFAEDCYSHHSYLQRVPECEFDGARSHAIEKQTGGIRDDLRELLHEITAAVDD